MTIHQLSVFVENKSGTLLQVLELLKEAHIQLIASTISDTVEYGIYRIICSEPLRAYEVLKDAGISANVSEVFAISLDNEPGRAADAIRSFSETGIGISYLYSFLLGGKGILVFRTDNTEKTREVILEKKLQYIDEDGLAESQAAIANEVDGTVDKESEELCQVFIAVKKFHEHKKKKELCTISQCESTNKK